MRGAGVVSAGPLTRQLVEINKHGMRDEDGTREGTSGDGKRHTEDDESRTNKNAEDLNNVCRSLVNPKAAVPTERQQPPGSVVHLEGFLPFRSIKVLLVENDDSTRHIVSALLRNCSYEVTAATNGQKAWNILEDLTNHVDLVLTEVDTPGLSGIGLLSKIMNHKTCKNIPVIMMSSNDSLGIVFKCLSKGAADFLVKPIRKNELKILWQHVWRKCQSSSGSGSESGIRTQKSTESKSVEGSENNTDSHDEEGNESIGLNEGNGSDRSGTQSSWSKRAMGVDSPQPMSPWEELEDLRDSTCAQVVYSSSEVPYSNWDPTNAKSDDQNKNDEYDNFEMGKDLKIGVPGYPDAWHESSTNLTMDGVSGAKDKHPNVTSKKDLSQSKGNLELNKKKQKGELLNKDTGHKVGPSNITNSQLEHASDIPSESFKIIKIEDTNTANSKETPALELSLKQLRDGDPETSVQEPTLLRHSDLSAFTRYNAISIANQTPTENVGSCSPLDNSLEARKAESMWYLRSNSSGLPNQGSNGSSNNDDMGSSTNNVKPEAFDEPTTKAVVDPCSEFQSVQNGQCSSLHPTLLNRPDDGKISREQQVQVQHHHHHYHHYHHHVHNMQQQSKLLDHESGRSVVSGSPKFGPTSFLATPAEGNATNYRSASGSNNGSNRQNEKGGQNGSSNIINDEGINVGSDKGETAGNCRTDGSGNGGRDVVQESRSAYRKAALNKFRLKRKERCFEKKVRYQSRKRLAEKRPRVRGQFVRQDADGSKTMDAGL